ncbi:uncharacterized protein LOC126587216 isoform X1 [Malus sylvestris]|uniref:uncharacterized protein LOC126587216 isoform X1 n=1 Tax=Malus sylvestris TaxID=3752 RepID=UPI0021AC217C|nr:uncharacterized protein LOC126587216 isoform X1 [Malus sylvestris]
MAKVAEEHVEARVKQLLSRMTLKDKVGQMTQIERQVATPAAVRDHSIGSIFSAPGNVPCEKASPSEWADMVDGLQRSALTSRLGIPLIYATDAVHGNGNVYGATIFPHNVGVGATRDADLAQRIGVATALEARACGFHYIIAPCVAVCKDPRWGRCYESYSEDTEIVSKMTSIVSGLQGQPPQGHPEGYPFIAGSNNTIACAMHFVGEGGTDKGVNEGNAVLSYEDLERIHMKPYLDCISQGVCTIMASYNSWNGDRVHGHRFLLTEILKDKLGFKVRQPYNLHNFSFVSKFKWTVIKYKHRRLLLLQGILISDWEGIDQLCEHPFADKSLQDAVGCKLHRDLAREAVRRSLVLLKNGKDPMKPFLPLDRNAKRILVAGTHADDLGNQCGGWTATKYGSSGQITIGTTILEAIKMAVGDDTEIIYEKYPSADTLAHQGISFAIVVVGEAPYAEGRGYSSELVIPFNGTDVISSIADRIPVLAILISGRPLVLEPSLLEKMDALVAAWLPGTEGEGIVDAIFGDFDFEGRLPVTWFKMVEQLPMHAADPLYPLGFGMVYNKV